MYLPLLGKFWECQSCQINLPSGSGPRGETVIHVDTVDTCRAAGKLVTCSTHCHWSAGVSDTRRSHKVEIDTPAANTVHTRMAPAFSETKGRKKICCRSENNVASQVRTQKFWLWKWLNIRKTSRTTHDSSHRMPPAFEPLESSRQQTCQITGWQMIGTFLLQRVPLLAFLSDVGRAKQQP